MSGITGGETNYSFVRGFERRSTSDNDFNSIGSELDVTLGKRNCSVQSYKVSSIFFKVIEVEEIDLGGDGLEG